MKTLIRVTVFAVLLRFIRTDLCSENFKLSQYSEGVMKQVLSVLIYGDVKDYRFCPKDIKVDDNEIKFWFYPPSNPNNSILLNKKSPTQLDLDKPIKALLPGWLCNLTNDYIPLLRNAYLKRGSFNVIGIDWSKYAMDIYLNCFCSIPKIAKLIGKFFCDLNRNSGFDLADVHLLGHSLGGQLSGFIGKETQRQCGKTIGRISGLDPAGPIFQKATADKRLVKTDAKFVDVIHTNQNFMGFYGNCGHKDFYPNCGTTQPGCLRITNETALESIINIPTRLVACNHLRSIEYFTESISSDKFVATSCRSCPGVPLVGVCTKDLIMATETKMGEYTPADSTYNKYYVPTNSKSPFAQG